MANVFDMTPYMQYGLGPITYRDSLDWLFQPMGDQGGMPTGAPPPAPNAPGVNPAAPPIPPMPGSLPGGGAGVGGPLLPPMPMPPMMPPMMPPPFSNPIPNNNGFGNNKPQPSHPGGGGNFSYGGVGGRNNDG